MSQESMEWSGTSYAKEPFVEPDFEGLFPEKKGFAYEAEPTEKKRLFYEGVLNARSELVKTPSAGPWLQERLERSVQQLKELVDVNNDVRSGIPVIKGTRFTLSQLIAEVAESDLLKDLADDLSLNLEAVSKILHCISVNLDRPMQR